MKIAVLIVLAALTIQTNCAAQYIDVVALNKTVHSFHNKGRAQFKRQAYQLGPTYRMLTRKYNKSRRAQYLMQDLTPEEQAIRQARIRRYYRKRGIRQ